MHAHYPPGYPLVLALTWWLTGTSARAAHLVSTLCTVGASLAAWWWFRRLMAGPAALILGLALAVNWLWARTGGAIQSEPLYMLLGQFTILAAARAGRHTDNRVVDSIVLGTLLAACLLTRHVGLGLALGILLDLALRARWRTVLTVVAIATLLVSPWLAWMAAVGASSRTQAALFVQGYGTGTHRLALQLAFYVQRIPDQLTGPFVEVATVFQRLPVVAAAANIWAVLATALIVLGWVCTLGRPRRRLAGLIPLITLGMLLAWPFTEAGRFLIPLIPCLLIGMVEGLTALTGRLHRLRERGVGLRPSRSRLRAASLVLAASLPYSGYMLWTGRARVPEAGQREFDAACDWLAVHPDRTGPVLSRHPGEVFWRTGRQGLEVHTAERPGDSDADAAAIARTISAYGVAYLLIDQNRYADAPPSPLTRFVAQHPERVRQVWGHDAERSSVMLYQVEPIR
jgi:hypothetical protein